MIIVKDGYLTLFHCQDKYFFKGYITFGRYKVKLDGKWKVDNNNNIWISLTASTKDIPYCGYVELYKTLFFYQGKLILNLHKKITEVNICIDTKEIVVNRAYTLRTRIN